jgi:isopentenyl-diphosphate delta-isomerase
VTEFIYQTPVPPNLIEHEYLHVFLGFYDDQDIKPVSEEVMNYIRVTQSEFTERVMIDDPTIAPWTKITWKQIQKRLKEDIQEI